MKNKKCNGKRGFDTLQQAQQAAAALAKKRKKQGLTIAVFLRAYGCPCGKFHFGSTKNIDWSLVK